MVSASNREPLCHCRENNYLPCGSSKQNRSLNLTQILQSVQAIKYSLQINHLLDSGGQTFTHNDCYNRAKTVVTLITFIDSLGQTTLQICLNINLSY